jgi:hypothetical protein
MFDSIPTWMGISTLFKNFVCFTKNQIGQHIDTRLYKPLNPRITFLTFVGFDRLERVVKLCG